MVPYHKVGAPIKNSTRQFLFSKSHNYPIKNSPVKFILKNTIEIIKKITQNIFIYYYFYIYK